MNNGLIKTEDGFDEVLLAINDSLDDLGSQRESAFLAKAISAGHN